MLARSLGVAGAAVMLLPLASSDASAFFFHRDHGYSNGCYKSVYVPPVYGWQKVRYTVRHGRHRFVRTPAVYSWKRVRVMVRRGYYTSHTTPPVYGWRTETRTYYPHRRSLRDWLFHRRHRHYRGSYKDASYKDPAPVVKTYRYRTLIRGGERVYRYHPPVYAWKKVRVQTRSPWFKVVYEPPVYGWKRVRVMKSRGYYKQVRVACARSKPATYSYHRRARRHYSHHRRPLFDRLFHRHRRHYSRSYK